MVPYEKKQIPKAYCFIDSPNFTSMEDGENIQSLTFETFNKFNGVDPTWHMTKILVRYIPYITLGIHPKRSGRLNHIKPGEIAQSKQNG